MDADDMPVTSVSVPHPAEGIKYQESPQDPPMSCHLLLHQRQCLLCGLQGDPQELPPWNNLSVSSKCFFLTCMRSRAGTDSYITDVTLHDVMMHEFLFVS